ncbi:leucine-rich repeat-containing protein 61 isoform X5 [Rhinoraja longicauda]
MEPCKARAEDEDVKITVELLKSITGEFDLESILFLKLTKMNPLYSCENLQNLNLAGNLISSVDVLRSITKLKNLDTIRLKDTVCSFSNPVCMNTSYLNTMLDMFPNIKILDGERVSGRGSDLYRLCKDIDDSLKEIDSNPPLCASVSPTKWVEDRYWELKPMQQTRTDKASEQVFELLKECRELKSKAADVITKTKRMPRAGK